MISPDEVRKKANAWWIDLLRATLDGNVEACFPRDIPQIGLDRAADKLIRSVAINQEQDALKKQSKAVMGYGYTLEWKTKYSHELKTYTTNITAIRIEALADWLALTEKTDAYARFVVLIDQTRRHVPELTPWVRTQPRRLLENAADWPNWLATCRFFIDDYVPDRSYARQLPLPIHTKFLEEHNSFLMSLLTAVKPCLIRNDHRDWRQ